MSLELGVGTASNTQAPAAPASASNHPVPVLTGDLTPVVKEATDSAPLTEAEPSPITENTLACTLTSTKVTNPIPSAGIHPTSGTEEDPTTTPTVDRTLPSPQA